MYYIHNKFYYSVHVCIHICKMYVFAKHTKSIWIVIYNLEISWKLQMSDILV